MSSGFTGNEIPMSCEALRKAPLRTDICFACFDGVFCNKDETVCHDLSGCSIDGTQICSFFKSCQEDTSLTINNNTRSQYVTRCKVDGLRVTIFVLGCILTLAFLFIMGSLVLDHLKGKATRFANPTTEGALKTESARARSRGVGH